jgi:hypothetical protein
MVRYGPVIVALFLCGDLQATKAPRDYLRLMETFTSNCMLHEGSLLLIENTHPSNAIEVTLERVLGDVRQPGRSVIVLKAKAEPTKLGCNSQGGIKQHWEIIEAAFVD